LDWIGLDLPEPSPRGEWKEDVLPNINEIAISSITESLCEH